MNLSLDIAMNIFSMLTLIGGVSYVMSRATRLRPHVPAGEPPAAAPVHATRGATARGVRPATAALVSVRAQ